MRRSRPILNLVYVHQVDEDRSHATGPSKVPKSVQDAVPKGVEESLPDSESILPKKVQEKVPESIERAVPNAIHDTGDTPVKGVKK
ncbi:Transcriptional activator protein acu-15 [Fusarium oxysporum f. sp. albedinis]|nr:Transcriptional activator protein acu-15 [Fusarium oxysporum f. sp. albedinis]